jgi:hypothetical protein
MGFYVISGRDGQSVGWYATHAEAVREAAWFNARGGCHYHVEPA